MKHCEIFFVIKWLELFIYEEKLGYIIIISNNFNTYNNVDLGRGINENNQYKKQEYTNKQ
jgi:hypothetical protein